MKTNLKLITTCLTCVLLFVACKNEVKEEIAKIEKTPGINLNWMNQDISPKEDFYTYVNGKWLDSTKIPEDRPRWGSFDELRQKTDEDILSILNSAMSDNKDLNKINVLPGSDQGKAIQLFQTIMDTVGRNEQDIEPVKSYLTKIKAIENIDDLQHYLIEMEPKGGAGFFDFSVGPDTKNSDINAAFLGASGLGLPDRDYYVKNDEDSKEKREKYVGHITRMLQFLGESETSANAQANQILAFETQLAEPQMDKVDRRDARKRYNPRSIDDLQKMVSVIDWKNYFKGIGVKELDTIIVSEVKYMDALQNILAQNNVSDWKAYLKWTAFNRASPLLSTEIEKANWDFYSKELQGSIEQRPQDERAIQTLNGTIGEALGKLYVDQKFPPEAKVRAEKMIQNVIKAFQNRIQVLPWMTDETKEKATEKLLALKVKIAYPDPDKWEDYSKLEVKGVENGGSYIQNMINANIWSHNKQLEDLGNPVDKTKWIIPPQTVNAGYLPPYNEIIFPAAILQPPFFNFNADDAVNYGAIGAGIGHEISHAFDDSGSRYDKDGNLNNWWTDEDLEQFEALGKELADQYSELEVLPDVFINGPFTLGENIGDLGGINAAYDALMLNYEETGRPEDIDGLTAEQRFFISWGTIWRTKIRDDALINQIKTDPHSPGIYRAVQPLLNMDAFYDAFNVQEGDKLYLEPDKRVKIW
ncbi:M13 family metallopeptidase [Yeosuana sp. MJ-SS3]|uniref:M13 family metallopeptidase n=1 Tax=Gilvirhabdus luticola TaxID=3079858 RepID=A0ABU3U8I1_9FLAO|nr:M13 family metallopeptidase [Yeosuana sp. MJ-SS3]MDU8886734.1 M13 family metallopeptidase [Yeosuana sp. MJ-SS3]